MNEDDLPFLQILFNGDEAPPPPHLAPLALQPFRLSNFQFASVHNGVIGSLYFADYI